MNYLLKYFKILVLTLLLIVVAFPAFEDFEVPADNLAKITTFPVNYQDFFQVEYQKKILPGQVLTINVSVVKPQEVTVDSVTIMFAQKYFKISEYELDTYIGHLTVPEQPGNYYFEVIFKGEPFDRQVSGYYFQVEPLICSINFFGYDQDLSEVIKTKKGEFINEMKLKVDLSHLKALGIFKSVSYNYYLTSSGICLDYLVSLNPVVKSTSIVGSLEISEKKLNKVLSVTAGEVFSFNKMVKDIKAIEQYYHDRGFVFAKVVDYQIPHEDNDYQLCYYLNEGLINDIVLQGNNRTQDYVIFRELSLKKGMAFNAEMLKSDLRNVYNLNYFANIVPDIRTINDQRDVDLIIKLEEKKTSSINFGGGYGEISGWFGFIDLYLDNLKGTAQSVLLKSSWGDRVNTYQIRYHNPWMWDRRVSLTTKLWSTRSISYLVNKTELKTGWSASIGRPRGINLRENYSFVYEDVLVPSEIDFNHKKRILGYSIARDTRDNFLNPRKGDYNSFALSKGLTVLDGNIDNWKLRLEHNSFFQLAEKQVFALKGSYDVIFGDVIITDEFYVGTDTTVRGYDRVFAKGRERWIFNFEYRYLFNDIFQMYAFYDIGQALDSVDEYFVNHLGWGASQGFGLRFMLPIGPIGLVYGWPQYKTIDSATMTMSIGYPF